MRRTVARSDATPRGQDTGRAAVEKGDRENRRRGPIPAAAAAGCDGVGGVSIRAAARARTVDDISTHARPTADEHGPGGQPHRRQADTSPPPGLAAPPPARSPHAQPTRSRRCFPSRRPRPPRRGSPLRPAEKRFFRRRAHLHARRHATPAGGALFMVLTDCSSLLVSYKERKQRAVGGRAGLTGAATKPARSQGCSSRDRGSRKPDVFSPEERPREFFHGPPRGCGTRLGRVH